MLRRVLYAERRASIKYQLAVRFQFLLQLLQSIYLKDTEIFIICSFIINICITRFGLDFSSSK